MKLSYIIRLLLILTLGSMCILSSTLARYSDEYSGNDTALVAKWNFRVGTSEDNLHNLGFTFDVFGGEALKPQAKGENTFYLSGGESDVAIDYEVFMNVKVLQIDIDENNGDDDDFPPLIFYVSSGENGANIENPYDKWFDLQNIEADEDGYFRIASGHLEAGSSELLPITIHWWWNTSFYVGNDPRTMNNTDESEDGNYYAVAYADYLYYKAQYDFWFNQFKSFWANHQQVVTTVDEVEVVSYECTVQPCPHEDSESAHWNAYEVLQDAVDKAQDAIDNCDKMKYDQYDTKALSALQNLDESSPQSIMIKVNGEQVAPEQLEEE